MNGFGKENMFKIFEYGFASMKVVGTILMLQHMFVQTETTGLFTYLKLSVCVTTNRIRTNKISASEN